MSRFALRILSPFQGLEISLPVDPGRAHGVRLPWAIFFRASSPSQPANRNAVVALRSYRRARPRPQRRWRCFHSERAPKVAPPERDNLALEATIPLGLEADTAKMVVENQPVSG